MLYCRVPTQVNIPSEDDSRNGGLPSTIRGCNSTSPDPNPAITGGHVVNDKERSLLALPPRLGGLGLKNFVDTASHEYDNSRGFTVNLKNLLLNKNEEGGKTKH